jgi:trimethylamine:corrinoid methyltransferase-like protein
VFSNALARHAEMPAELVESLAVVLVKLIEKGAPVWVGQGFKDSVHVHIGKDMQPNGCISVLPSQIPRQASLPQYSPASPSLSRTDHFFR